MVSMVRRRLPGYGRLAMGGFLLTAGALYTADRVYSDNRWWRSLRIVRFGRAVYATAAVSVDYKWSLSRVKPDTEEYEKVKSEVHIRSAHRLREMCTKNGALFIKVGQHVGSMDYLLPPEYVNTFKLFHRTAPETPLPLLKKVLEDELGKPADEVFSSLSEEPLGAASLAQVHLGKLVDGSLVAVKIQHPDVKMNAYSDMAIITFLVECVSRVFPRFQFKWLVREMQRNLPDELNFRHEADNIETVALLSKHLKFLKVPRVCYELTTPRVLVMEYCSGGRVDNLDYIKKQSISVDEVARKLGQLYSEMIFRHGFMHCDPHPGNVLVRRKDLASSEVEVVLLDHGLYQQLTDSFRLTYCRLWQALITKDMAAIKTHCLELNAGELYPLLACVVTARTWENIEGGITSTDRTESEEKLIQLDAFRYFAELSQLLNSVPRELVLILKTNDLLRGLEHTLGSSIHSRSFLTMSKYCVRTIGKERERLSASWYQKMAIKLHVSLQLLVIRVYEIWLWSSGAVLGK